MEEKHAMGQGKAGAVMDILTFCIKHETIMKFMRGEIRGWGIPAEDVLPYTPGSEVECIVMGIATSTEADASKRAYYGRRFINGLLHFTQELAAKNITITKFYATSVTPNELFQPHGELL